MSQVQIPDYGASPFRDWLRTPVVSSFIAGGCAGAVSRTVVSPFERMKIIFQVQNANAKSYDGMWATLMKMWREEGWRGFMRGNGINCVRIVPYSAVQFCTYTLLKQGISQDARELTASERLLAGALAGIASVCATYPMDIVRTRLSIQTASIGSLQKENLAKPPGMWATMAQMYKTEGGMVALWRGLIPTTLGVAPYVGINFACYEYLRDRLAVDNSKLSSYSTLTAGAVSGAIAQTFTYPFDVLRRRFQVESMNHGRLGYQYNSTWGALKTIVANEGFVGLYRGLGPNLLKVVPAMASSFWTFESVRRLLA
ncbi:hypothetical protein B9G98_04067 [Wickerhamiella sorbophila]|uniref:Mitochondrial thiamine pyrophosphate carrier 1 n=1 Tax=Wickerhamiella sorbophila TaxID=45607 RepID=A0A2T0FN96_9ASCO|nr:hypothetical protein B9G98_04067 [Wickerhamiella sorbophila]PRT56447.1 hypothetical protein B9G98_04067 [Wickerhamiella sorbophila]